MEREGQVVAGCQFQLFNWSVIFKVKKEPTVVAQWIFLPRLPLMLYQLNCLQILAIMFGKFLGIDNTTLYPTKARRAQICVEIDLLNELVKGFLLIIGQKHSVWQEVAYEKLLLYLKKNTLGKATLKQSIGLLRNFRKA